MFHSGCNHRIIRPEVVLFTFLIITNNCHHHGKICEISKDGYTPVIEAKMRLALRQHILDVYNGERLCMNGM